MSVTIPKNVRQMGEPEEARKIYVEDYVVTYLRQYAKEDIQNPRAAILLGSAQEQEGIPYLFIRSALELAQCTGADGTLRITDQIWMQVYEEAEKYFEGQEILGWFLSTPGYAPEVNYELLNVHRSSFPGKERVLFLEDPTEGEEAFFAMEGDNLARQNGYFIFYERNEPMQQYMLEKKDGKSVDAEGGFSDRAARNFRMVVQEKKDESSQKRVVAFLYGVSTFLVMVVLVIGITMINNYEKMEQVELALQNLTQNLEEQQEPVQAEEQMFQQEAVEAVSEQADTEDRRTQESEEQLQDQQPSQEEQNSQEQVPPSAESSAAEEAASQVQDVQVSVSEIPESYIVQKGDTLLNISRKFYGNDRRIQDICQLNHIDDSDKIFAGEKILLP